jgi:hypothetical protein
VRSRRLHIMLVLMLLVQPVIGLAYACDMPDTHSDTLVTVIDTSELISSSDLAASPQTEHGSCHDQPTVPEVESGSCDNCPDGIACSSSCSAPGTVVSASPAGGVMPDHAMFLPIQTYSHPSSIPTGLYRPPRLS